MRRRQIVLVLAGFGVLVAAGLAALVALTGSSDEDLVVYTARLHYGEEEVFRRFADETGYDLKLFGGTGSALTERLRSEGADTEADVLVTVDGANLQQALESDLLQPLSSPAVEAAVPENLRDPEGRWTALTTRARTIMRSTERVTGDDVPRRYEELGDPRFDGRLCLRTSDSVYNSSFVADRIAKDGTAATERMLRSWMANDPVILGSDVDVLEAIEAGSCDVGLTNHYYLGRILAEDPEFPVTPVWADQGARGAHVNLSGVGIVRHSDNVPVARELVEFLVEEESQAEFAETNSEFPANPRAELPDQLAEWRGFRVDPIDVTGDAGLQADAVKLMNEVGWR
ncbi:MAG TPA: extracellular solute-binding protein [Thermoleophilaceae bacterium]|nr:extracellular solute-binding protein [Thermoleophilaceae bacterium]